MSPRNASFVHFRKSVLGVGFLSSWVADVELEVFFPTTAAVFGVVARGTGLIELGNVIDATGTPGRTAGAATVGFVEGMDDLFPTVIHAPPPDVACDAYGTPTH